MVISLRHLRLLAARRRLRRAYGAGCRNRGTGRDDDDALSAEYRAYTDPIDDEIWQIKTRYWLARANRKSVPAPPWSDETMWEECAVDRSQKVLTNKGISTVRSSLRAERKEAHEGWQFYLSAIAAIASTIAAVLGIVLMVRGK